MFRPADCQVKPKRVATKIKKTIAVFLLATINILFAFVK
jgi:hypothetical protein